MSLPRGLPKTQMESTWATQIEPVIAYPPNQGLILKNVALVSGMNVINTKLQRPLQGWIPTRLSAAVTLYDQQNSNQTPGLTLVLVASADVVCDLWVF